MNDIIIGEPLHKDFMKKYGPILLSPTNGINCFDYFLDGFGEKLQDRELKQECILVNSFASNLTTDYQPYPKWNVTKGDFVIHQTEDIKEGLNGLEDENYALFNSGWFTYTVLIDAWLGAIGTWVSVIGRNAEIRYVVVGEGEYEWEKEVQLEIYHRKNLVWQNLFTKETNELNTMPFGFTMLDNRMRVSNTDDELLIKEIYNFDFQVNHGFIGIGSSKSIVDGKFTGIAAVHFFGGVGMENRSIQL